MQIEIQSGLLYLLDKVQAPPRTSIHEGHYQQGVQIVRHGLMFFLPISFGPASIKLRFTDVVDESTSDRWDRIFVGSFEVISGAIRLMTAAAEETVIECKNGWHAVRACFRFLPDGEDVGDGINYEDGEFEVAFSLSPIQEREARFTYVKAEPHLNSRAPLVRSPAGLDG